MEKNNGISRLSARDRYVLFVRAALEKPAVSSVEKPPAAGTRLKSLDELRAIREKATKNTGMRTTGENPDRTVIAVGMATCGIAAGAREVSLALLDETVQQKAENVSVVSTGCLGFCYAEPLVEVREPDKEPVRYQKVTAELAREIVREHVLGGRIVEKALFRKDGPAHE